MQGPQGVNQFLRGLPVWAVTNAQGSPVFEPDDSISAGRSGRFYFSQADADAAKARLVGADGEAAVEVRTMPLVDVYLPLIDGGDPKELGGTLRLEPLRTEVRHAQQILQGLEMGPPGSVPLFMYPGLELSTADGKPFLPAFLREQDLRAMIKKSGSTPEPTKIQVTILQEVVNKLGQMPQGPRPILAVPALDDQPTPRRMS